MTNDLLGRLHDLHRQATVERSHFYVGKCVADAMHRIEELEADLRKMALDYLAAQGQAAEAYQAQLAAEAKLQKAVEIALEECPFAWGTGSYNDWWYDRRTTLAELKREDRG